MWLTFEPQVLRPSDGARRAEERLQLHVRRSRAFVELVPHVESGNLSWATTSVIEFIPSPANSNSENL